MVYYKHQNPTELATIVCKKSSTKRSQNCVNFNPVPLFTGHESKGKKSINPHPPTPKKGVHFKEGYEKQIILRDKGLLIKNFPEKGEGAR